MHIHADDDKNNEIPFSIISMSPSQGFKNSKILATQGLLHVPFKNERTPGHNAQTTSQSTFKKISPCITQQMSSLQSNSFPPSLLSFSLVMFPHAVSARENCC